MSFFVFLLLVLPPSVAPAGGVAATPAPVPVAAPAPAPVAVDSCLVFGSCPKTFHPLPRAAVDSCLVFGSCPKTFHPLPPRSPRVRGARWRQ